MSHLKITLVEQVEDLGARIQRIQKSTIKESSYLDIIKMR